MLAMVEHTKTDVKHGFRVWGVFDGEVFDRTWPTAAAWSAWRRLNERRYQIEVRGMASVEVAA
ncbi:hypothetical protein GGQ64_001324 [Rhizobium azooxidifex]|uniref:Uncharacterized protein n=1 Tax=Mycoplana azooxidifex TaxID=1636188 RepID=A0A7W6D8L0_9HYPH|nr:hypothetical protein [Mycoplana azooxidifex]MBB3976137.1 hypothetical protein [Mycoplana azooxidifex]